MNVHILVGNFLGRRMDSLPTIRYPVGPIFCIPVLESYCNTRFEVIMVVSWS
jgi:hypothetical protein